MGPDCGYGVTDKYRVVVVGAGKRGMHHAAAFQANGRFEVAGICDIDQARLDAAAARLGVAAKSTDARELAVSLRPDVFCFCTLPAIRSAMVRVGIESGARLIAMEKPVALTSAEGFAVRDMLESSGVKAVVSHQHRYGAHYQKVKETIASGALGRIETVYGTSTGWMMHMLSHLIDYMRWYNGEAEAEWVMAQASGRGKLGDVHPSPDYIAGFIHFANGVHGIVECGAGAPDVPESADGWRLARRHQAGRFFRRRLDGLRSRHAALHPADGRLAGRRQAGSSVQLRKRVPRLRDHDGLVPLGGAGRTNRPAARRRSQ